MHTRPRPTLSACLLAALIAALLTTVGVSPASAQATVSIVDPGSQLVDIGHRSCLQLETRNATGDVSFAAVDPARLPPGLSVTSSGLVEGVPEGTGGTFTAQVVASDDNGSSAPLTLRITTYVPTADDLVVKAGRAGDGFTIDCFAAGRAANQFLSDPANFGPGNGGIRANRLVVAEQSEDRQLTDAYLADADVIVDGFTWDINSNSASGWKAGEIDRLIDWVEAGGVLIAAEDSPEADRLGVALGVPTLNSIHCGPTDPDRPTCPTFRPKNATHPIVDGPFGTWSSLRTDGTVGWYKKKVGNGWKIAAVDGNGRATVIEKKLGNGHVILLTDEGLLRQDLAGDNGTFVGNLFAFALSQVSDAPQLHTDVAVGRIWQSFRLDLCRNDISLGDGPRTVSIVSGSLPHNLTRNGCVISGTPVPPQSLGNHQFTYQVRDRDGDVDTAMVSITINGDNPASTNPTCKGRRATIVGTSGDDVIKGTSGHDVIIGGGGDDVIDGRGGNDLICAGAGNDTVKGGNGADALYGENGKDRLIGGKGKPDLCHGGKGKDTTGKGCERRRRI